MMHCIILRRLIIMKWLLPDEMFPTFDDDVDMKKLSKEDVYNDGFTI